MAKANWREIESSRAANTVNPARLEPITLPQTSLHGGMKIPAA
jgi:hypothetical protein